MRLVGAPLNYMAQRMSKDDTIRVEVVYALPHKQTIIALEVQVGATAMEAAQRSGIASEFAEVDLDNATFGIFGQLVAPRQLLRNGDRVEIYRPLIADPKEVRKARAQRVRERRQQAKPG